MGKLRRGEYFTYGVRVRESTLRLLVIAGDDMVPEIFIHSKVVNISPPPVVVVVKVAATVERVRFAAC